MFIAIDKVFTLENILYLAKGACLSIAIAALSLLIGLILGTLGASGRRVTLNGLPSEMNS